MVKPQDRDYKQLTLAFSNFKNDWNVPFAPLHRTSFYLVTAACHFPPTRLNYNASKCIKPTCRIKCVIGELMKTFPTSSSKEIRENIIPTAYVELKCRHPFDPQQNERAAKTEFAAVTRNVFSAVLIEIMIHMKLRPCSSRWHVA